MKNIIKKFLVIAIAALLCFSPVVTLVPASAVYASTAKASVSVPAWKGAANTAKGIKLSWNAVSGAFGYRIYKSTGTGKYVKLATVKNKTAYTDKKVTPGTKYRYKIRAYVKSGKKTVWSKYSKIQTTYRVACYGISAALREVNNNGGTVRVDLPKNTNISGYQIKYTTGKTSKTVKVAVKKTSPEFITKNIKVTGNGEYTFRARAYKKVSSKTYYGGWSEKMAVNVVFPTEEKTTVDTCANGHDFYVVGVGKQPTCGTDGYNILSCKKCGAPGTEAIPATGEHNFKKVLKTPAVTEQVKVVDKEAWDEEVEETEVVDYMVCSACLDFWLYYHPGDRAGAWENAWRCRGDRWNAEPHETTDEFMEHCWEHDGSMEKTVKTIIGSYIGHRYKEKNGNIKIVHHDEEYHYETVVVTPAVYVYRCKTCKMELPME